MNIWKNTVVMGLILFASIFWFLEMIFGGTKGKSPIKGFYPPGAEPVVKIYAKGVDSLLSKGRKALGLYLESQDPVLYQRIKKLFM